MSGRPLRLLILEDRPEDADLALRQLRRAGFDPTWRRVEDEDGFRANLDPELDLIIADYHQPQFDALRALKLMQEAGLEIPFVLVSGAVGEDMAVAAVRLGAVDYVLKDRLGRLGTAVENALEQAKLRRRQQEGQKAMEHQALHDGWTALPDRLMVRQQIEKALTDPPSLAVMSIALDQVPALHDNFGHKIGDGLLGQIAPRLREHVDSRSLIARLGG